MLSFYYLSETHIDTFRKGVVWKQNENEAFASREQMLHCSWCFLNFSKFQFCSFKKHPIFQVNIKNKVISHMHVWYKRLNVKRDMGKHDTPIIYIFCSSLGYPSKSITDTTRLFMKQIFQHRTAYRLVLQTGCERAGRHLLPPITVNSNSWRF